MKQSAKMALPLHIVPGMKLTHLVALPFLLSFLIPQTSSAVFRSGVQEDACKICWDSGYPYCFKTPELQITCSYSLYDGWEGSREPNADDFVSPTSEIDHTTSPGGVLGSYRCPDTTSKCQSRVSTDNSKLVTAWAKIKSIGPTQDKLATAKKVMTFLGIPVEQLTNPCSWYTNPDVRDQCRLEKFFGIIGVATMFQDRLLAIPAEIAERRLAQEMVKHTERLMNNCARGTCSGAAFQLASRAAREGWNYMIYIIDGTLPDGTQSLHSITKLSSPSGKVIGYGAYEDFVESSLGVEEFVDTIGFSNATKEFEGSLENYINEMIKRDQDIASPASVMDPIYDP